MTFEGELNRVAAAIVIKLLLRLIFVRTRKGFLTKLQSDFSL